MMNRIDKTLKRLSEQHKKMLSPYLTAGDPHLHNTVELMHKLVRTGADILEIGMPFSDPMAEGPVIQAAMERALANGTTPNTVLSMVEEFRKQDNETPIILMGYLNPIEQYGYEAFAKQAHHAGVDGTIIVDLPPEESQAITAHWQAHALYPIYLCSPTTTEARFKQIAALAQGYLYYVSLKGVTGANTLDLDAVKSSYLRLKDQTDLPIMIGFGIKTPEMAAQVAAFADGVIVGAALIQHISEAATKHQDAMQAGAEFIHTMRKAIDMRLTDYE